MREMRWPSECGTRRWAQGTTRLWRSVTPSCSDVSRGGRTGDPGAGFGMETGAVRQECSAGVGMYGLGSSVVSASIGRPVREVALTHCDERIGSGSSDRSLGVCGQGAVQRYPDQLRIGAIGDELYGRPTVRFGGPAQFRTGGFLRRHERKLGALDSDDRGLRREWSLEFGEWELLELACGRWSLGADAWRAGTISAHRTGIRPQAPQRLGAVPRSRLEPVVVRTGAVATLVAAPLWRRSRRSGGIGRRARLRI